MFGDCCVEEVLRCSDALRIAFAAGGHDWDGGDCCPETNDSWEENYPEGLGRNTIRRNGKTYHQGCSDPDQPSRMYYLYNSKEGPAGEYKALFADCEIDGEPCSTKGLLLFVPPAFADSDSTLGWATFPWDDTVLTTSGGIVMGEVLTWGLAGSDGVDQATTLIHEGGHNLGLLHVHNDDSCSSECYEGPIDAGIPSSMLIGDMCSDTRPTVRNFDCSDPANGEQCLNQNAYNHYPDYVDTPYRNFMAYSSGDCMDRFSPQQLARVRCHMETKMRGWLEEDVPAFIPGEVTASASYPSGGSPKVVLEWSDATVPQSIAEQVSYEVVRRAAGSGDSWIEVSGSPVSTNSFTDSSVTAGGSYDYAVISILDTPSGDIRSVPYEVRAPAVVPSEEQARPSVACAPTTTLVEDTGYVTDGSSTSKPYENNAECSWAIDPEDGADMILLEFTLFQLGSGDTLEISQGTSGSGSVVATLSGRTVPDPITVFTENGIHVSLSSDGSRRGAGFSLQYSSCGRDSTCNGHGECNAIGECVCDSRFAGKDCGRCQSSYTGDDCDVWVSNGATCQPGPATLDAETGTVADGSGSSTYSNNLECRWLIQPEDAAVVILEFIDFNIERDYDYLTVYDGDSDRDSQLIRATGSSLPDTLVSSGGSVLLVFTTDGSETRPGWDIEYTSCKSWAHGDGAASCLCSGNELDCFVCHGGYSGDPFCGTCPDPGRAGDGTCDASNNVEGCLFDAGDCDPDADTRAPILSFSDAPWTPASMTMEREWSGRVRSDEPSTTITLELNGESVSVVTRSLSPETTVAFRLDGDDIVVGQNVLTASGVDEAGNEAVPVSYEWTVSEATCAASTVIDQSAGLTGTITDGTAAGSDYDNDIQCAWTLVAPIGYTVSVDITRLDVEPGTVSTVDGVAVNQCQYDYLRILDGATGPELAHLCGETPPAGTIESSGNTLIVSFSTDSSIVRTGWSLDYTMAAPPSAPACVGHTSLTAGSGELTDGSAVDAHYADDTDCMWSLSADADEIIVVQVDRIDLEAAYEASDGTMVCPDTLTIYDGADASGDPVAPPLCGAPSTTDGEGNPLFVVRSTSSDLTIVFQSDADGTATGFSLTYSAVASPFVCSELASVDSLSYECSGTRPGSVCSPSCDADNERLSIESALQGDRVCVVGDGDAAAWSGEDAECVAVGCEPTTVIDADAGSGYITEGSKPEDLYPHNTDCTWLISSDAGNDITLSILSLDLEAGLGTVACPWDSIKIFDGTDNSGNLIATLCGSDTVRRGGSFRASSGNMFVQFNSDSSVAASGFVAQYSSVAPQTCHGREHLELHNGGTFDDGSGAAGDYDPNVRCEWQIPSRDTEAVTITFTDVDVEADAGRGDVILTGANAAASLGTICPHDYVEVLELTEGNAWSPIGLFCGSHSSLTFTSETTSLLVRFKTNSAVQGEGWHASVSFARKNPPLCAPNTVLQVSPDEIGTFTDGSSPDENYEPFTVCSWTLEAPAGHGIELTFIRNDIESAGWCEYDFISILDGDLGDDTRPWSWTYYYGSGSTSEYYFNGYSTQSTGPCEVVRAGCRVTAPVDGGTALGIAIAVNEDATVDVLLDSGVVVSGLEHQDVAAVHVEHDENAIQVAAAFTRCSSESSHTSVLIPDVYTSTSQQITVLFVSDYILQKTGFEVRYVAYDLEVASGEVDCGDPDVTVDVEHGHWECDDPEHGIGSHCTVVCETGFALAQVVDGVAVHVPPHISRATAMTSIGCSRASIWSTLPPETQCVAFSDLPGEEGACSDSNCPVNQGFCARSGCVCLPGYYGDHCDIAWTSSQRFYGVTPWSECSDLCFADGESTPLSTREATCYELSDWTDGDFLPQWEAVDAEACSDSAVPPVSRPCNRFDCEDLPASDSTDEEAAEVDAPVLLTFKLRHTAHTVRVATANSLLAHDIAVELALVAATSSAQIAVMRMEHEDGTQNDVNDASSAHIVVHVMIMPGAGGAGSVAAADVAEAIVSAAADSTTSFDGPVLGRVDKDSIEYEFVRSPQPSGDADADDDGEGGLGSEGEGAITAAGTTSVGVFAVLCVAAAVMALL